jgi:hypothetical protein
VFTTVAHQRCRCDAVKSDLDERNPLKMRVKRGLTRPGMARSYRALCFEVRFSPSR